jgi:hypothetical protein
VTARNEERCTEGVFHGVREHRGNQDTRVRISAVLAQPLKFRCEIPYTIVGTP